MALDFPLAPVVGQQYPFTPVPGQPVFIWDGEKWAAAPLTAGEITGVVRYDAAQSLTTTQQTQARSNIYAAPFDAMAYSGMQINGGMDVSQEFGSSVITYTPPNASRYAVDGWIFSVTQATPGSTVFSASQIGSVLNGIPKAMRMKATTGAFVPAGGDDNCNLTQRIEGYRFAKLGFGSASGQSVTLSFWIRASKTGIACVLLGSAAAPYFAHIKEYTINVANTWEYKTVTFPPETTSSASWPTENTDGADLVFTFGAGSNSKIGTAGVWAPWTTQYATANQVNLFAANNDTVDITGVTVLPGTQAPTAAQSPNIMRPYDQELVTCQRYLWYWNGPNATRLATGYCDSTTTAQAVVYVPVSMRAAPTTSMNNMLLNSNPVTAVTYMGMSENAVSLIWSGSGLTAGGAAQIWAYSPNGIVMLDARL